MKPISLTRAEVAQMIAQQLGLFGRVTQGAPLVMAFAADHSVVVSNLEPKVEDADRK